MRKTKEQPTPEENEGLDQELARLCNYLASIATHPKTPRGLREGLTNSFIDAIANESGYAWDTDAEGLRFMLPRLLSHMRLERARGIVCAMQHMVKGAMPEEIRKQLWQASYAVQEGGASDA